MLLAILEAKFERTQISTLQKRRKADKQNSGAFFSLFIRIKHMYLSVSIFPVVINSAVSTS